MPRIGFDYCCILGSLQALAIQVWVSLCSVLAVCELLGRRRSRVVVSELKRTSFLEVVLHLSAGFQSAGAHLGRSSWGFLG